LKILVRATNWVGDAVMSLPALRAIRSRWPQAEIAVLARSWVADLYRHQGCADRLLVYDHRGRHSGFWGRERLVRELRAERFDVAMLLQNAFDAAWLAWRAGIPERIGYARDGRSWLLTSAIALPVGGEIPLHQSYYYGTFAPCRMAGPFTDG
jgi:heptosyltransferase-2